ncbi:MAG: biogenesis protein MshI [Proteobacteria bacterium]|nr:MAG: biogenesis protein MshI [Pseudomonadota bacterium]
MGWRVLINWFGKRKSSSFVGVEIRTDGISLAKTCASGDGRRSLEFHGFEPCNAADRENALTKLVEASRSSGASCNLVLTNNQYQVFQIERPAVDDAELRDSLHWKLNDLIDYPLDDAVSDLFEFPEDASRGRKLINAVCARKSILKEYVALLKKCHLDLVSIDIIDLALRNIARTFIGTGIETEGAVGFLYLRNGFGMMILVKGENLYLSRKIDVDVDALKDPSRQETVMQKLSLEVQRSLDYVESQLRQIPPRQLLLLGPDISFPLPQLLDPLLAVSVEDANFDGLLPEQDSANLTTLVQTLVAVGGACRRSEAV